MKSALSNYRAAIALKVTAKPRNRHPLPASGHQILFLSGRESRTYTSVVYRIFLISVLVVTGLAPLATLADTYKLTSGREISGEVLPSSANDLGITIKTGDEQYQQVSWASFSQEALKELAKNKKLDPFVSPFIEVTQAERIKRTEVHIKPPPRLERPAAQSLLGALFSSGIGLFVLFVLYVAAIYAGFEVAIFRARPPLLVAGLSAIPFLGVLAPIVFLSLPTRTKPAEAPIEEAPMPAAEVSDNAVPATNDDNPMHASGAQHPSALRLAHSTAAETSAAPPPTQTFQRGQFTFNRRFFETKFTGFFGVVRRDADKDMLLVIKSARGEYPGQRITRIAPNDLHLQILRGGVTEEVMIPFQEIREIQLKHKDAN